MEYLTGSLTFTAQADAVSPHKDGGVVVHLTSSTFFPLSGGQLGDIGTIGSIAVTNTISDKEKGILHIMAAEPPLNTNLECVVDAKYREQNSVTHTGQHIFSSVAKALFQAETSSFTMGPSLSTLELSKKLTINELVKIEDDANRIIAQCIPVASFMIESESTLEQHADLLRKVPKDASYPLRVVNIEGVDKCLCCGTHVDNTGKCGLVKVFSSESSRGGVKIQFAVGERALSLVNERMKIMTEACAALTTGPGTLVNCIEALKSERKALRNQIKGFIKMLIPILKPCTELNFKGVTFAAFNLHDFPPLVQSDVMKLGSMHNLSSVIIIYRGEKYTTVSLSSVSDAVAKEIAGCIQALLSDVQTSVGGAKGRYALNYVRMLKDAEVATLLGLLSSISQGDKCDGDVESK